MLNNWLLWVAIGLGGVFGLLVGAIGGAFILRDKKTLALTSRRACTVCAAPVKVQDCLPVIGTMMVAKRCGSCSEVRPRFYLVFEIALAVLGALFTARAFFLWGVPGFIDSDLRGLLLLRDLVAVIALVLVFAFDWLAKVIPDRITLPAIILIFVLNLALGYYGLDLLFGGLLLGGFFAFQLLLSRGAWVGGGDVRLAVLVGVLLGPIVGLFALLLAYVLGAVIGGYLLLTKRIKFTSHVPFGTFFAAATLMAMILGQGVVTEYLAMF